MKFPIKKSRSFFRKFGSYASYASCALYASCASCASCASYAWHASENRRMFGIKAMGTNAFQRPRLLLPPPTGRSPSLDEGGLGFRASSQSLVYNPGSRVATLVVSMGVMGFLGDLRGRNSKSPPNPLGLAERAYSFHRPRGGPPPSKREVLGFAGQGLRPCRR